MSHQQFPTVMPIETAAQRNIAARWNRGVRKQCPGCGQRFSLTEWDRHDLTACKLYRRAQRKGIGHETPKADRE